MATKLTNYRKPLIPAFAQEIAILVQTTYLSKKQHWRYFIYRIESSIKINLLK